MNENIDLTKILEGCPEGTKFYSSNYGNVQFIGINLALPYPIRLMAKNADNDITDVSITKRGTHHSHFDGECTLFPSKDQRDWSKFVRFWDKHKEDYGKDYKDTAKTDIICKETYDNKVEGLVEEEDEETNWKPSKEEMDVLYGLAYITNKYDEHKEEVIARLYQDLKREFFNGSSYENMFPNTENDVRRRSTIQVLEYARSLDNYNQYGKADIDKNIAWLEKQGKSALETRTDNELIEEEVGLVDKFSSRWVNEFNLPEGYEFKDEKGNVIDATKIVLEKKGKV